MSAEEEKMRNHIRETHQAGHRVEDPVELEILTKEIEENHIETLKDCGVLPNNA